MNCEIILSLCPALTFECEPTRERLIKIIVENEYGSPIFESLSEPVLSKKRISRRDPESRLPKRAWKAMKTDGDIEMVDSDVFAHLSFQKFKCVFPMYHRLSLLCNQLPDTLTRVGFAPLRTDSTSTLYPIWFSDYGNPCHISSFIIISRCLGLHCLQYDEQLCN